MDLNLEEKGFELIAKIDNYYPHRVMSSKYEFKSIYYNEKTNEIKATIKKTQRSKILEHKEIPIEEIKALDNENPIKIALLILESEKFKNSNHEDKKQEIKKINNINR